MKSRGELLPVRRTRLAVDVRIESEVGHAQHAFGETGHFSGGELWLGRFPRHSTPTAEVVFPLRTPINDAGNAESEERGCDERRRVLGCPEVGNRTVETAAAGAGTHLSSYDPRAPWFRAGRSPLICSATTHARSEAGLATRRSSVQLRPTRSEAGPAARPSSVSATPHARGHSGPAASRYRVREAQSGASLGHDYRVRRRCSPEPRSVTMIRALDHEAPPRSITRRSTTGTPVSEDAPVRTTPVAVKRSRGASPDASSSMWGGSTTYTKSASLPVVAIR